MKLLLLCHDNTTRSALAEAVIKKHAPGLEVRSAGFGKPGWGVTKRMMEAARVRGYMLGEHRSQLVDRDMMIGWADLVVYMDDNNYNGMKQLLNGSFSETQAACLGDWARPVVVCIPDGSEDFRHTVELIIEAAKNLAQELID